MSLIRIMSTYRYVTGVLVLFLAVSTLVATKIKFNYHHGFEGIFILNGEKGAWLEICDDLFPEESQRLLWGKPLSYLKQVSSNEACTASNKPCANYEWNEKAGRGFIKLSYPDGRKLIINLGRFLDSNGKQTSGLFLGGGLPPSDPDYRLSDRNETGMAYYDGHRYYHIWCNANEGIADAVNTQITPSNWQFISSRVLESSADNVTIVSNHRVLVNNVPVIIERLLFYQTGNHFVTLVTNFRNIGTAPTTFSYSYGDEPWIGDYGSSAGNVGWLKNRIILRESEINTEQQSYAGMVDYGNPLAGEHHEFYSRKANFIEWQPSNRPDLAYFANKFDAKDTIGKNLPLTSMTDRVINLIWGPDTLKPGESFSFTIAVGMADNDPKTGFPVKPDTHLH